MYLFSKSRFKFVWVLTTLWVTGLILASATIYFRNGPTPIFLLEKGELRHDPLWRTAFNFHIIGACICLGLGPLLMIPKLIKFRRTHAVLGYIYINAVLWIAAPTGLIISPAAKGGSISAAGFIVTGIFWWLSTWLGYRAIRNGDIPTHIRWMVRSYAVAVSAVSFRIIQYFLSFGMSDLNAYTASVWLSLLVSPWMSETCIARHFPKHGPLQNSQTYFTRFRFLKGKMS